MSSKKTRKYLANSEQASFPDKETVRAARIGAIMILKSVIQQEDQLQ